MAADRRAELGRRRAWGDYHFARALQRSLERAGHPTRSSSCPNGHRVAAREDVAVHVFGLKEAPIHPRPGQHAVADQPPGPRHARMYERYDHVFVASDAFAERMAGRRRRP